MEPCTAAHFHEEAINEFNILRLQNALCLPLNYKNHIMNNETDFQKLQIMM